MPKDWTGSAMPSIVKGFAIIGQPFTKEQFKDAFGVDMPDVTFTEEEKRYQQRRNGVQDQPETEPFVQTQEQTVPSPIPVQTAKPAGSFGQRVLQHIEAANPQWAQTEQNEKPVNIEINGVGNSQPEELPQNRTKTKDVVKTIDDPYASEALSILRERNRTRNARTPETGTPSASTLHTISETTPARTGPETGRSVMNYLHQTGEYENADNIAAQPDPTGKNPHALEPVRQGINRATRDIVERSAALNRQQQETGNDNHLLNWAADVSRQQNLQTPITHSRQDYGPGYAAILEHEANTKLAEAQAEPIETDINGKEKYQIVGDAFKNEYLTEPGKQIMSIGSLINHGASTLNGDIPVNPELTEKIDEGMLDLFKQSNQYIAQSVPMEKVKNLIVNGNDEKTAENIEQFMYELLGEKGPYAVAGIAGGSLTAGAGIAAGTASLYKLGKDITTNLAEANANIIKETGRQDWELAFKIALQTTLGGRAIDSQTQQAAQRSGLAGRTFLDIMNHAIKKRFNSMVNEWNIKKVNRVDTDKNDNK